MNERGKNHLDRKEILGAVISGGYLGIVVGFFQYHGIPPTASLSFMIPGFALATVDIVNYDARVKGMPKADTRIEA